MMRFIRNSILVLLCIAIPSVSLNARDSSSRISQEQEAETAEPYYDFQTCSASIASNLISMHQPVVIFYGVVNRGNTSLNQGLHTGFYLSENIELDAGDYFLGSSSIGGLDTSHTYWNHIEIDSLDFSAIAEGVLYLIAACDYDEKYSESNEDNNLFITQVLVNKSENIRENLTLSSLQPPVDTISSGQPVKAVLRASSAFDTQKPLIDLYLSADTLLDSEDQLVKSYSNISLATNGSSVNIEFTCYLDTEGGIKEGRYYLIAVLDKENQIIEYDETDNTGIAEIYLTDRIIKDLGLEEITLNCDSLLNSEWLYVYANVRNNGSSKSVLGRLYAYLSEDSVYDATDVLIDQDYFNTLDPGATTRRGFYYQDLQLHEPGDYYILVLLDPMNEVNEVNESNNFGIIPLRLLDPAQVDRFDAELLQIIAPDTVAPGTYHHLGFNCFFYNDERAPLNAAIYLSTDSALNTEDLSSRLVQEGFYCFAYQEVTKTYYYQFDHHQDTGKFYLIVKLDDYNYLTEDNEENNLLIKPIYVYPDETVSEGDLKTSDIKINPAILGSSSKLEGSLMVYPQFSTTLDTSYIEYYISAGEATSEELVFVEQLYNLRTSSQYVSFSIDLPTGIEPGPYRLRCQAKTKPGIIDFNPANNEDFAYFAIQDVDLDFSIDQLQINSVEYFQSEPLIAGFNVRNNGTTIPAIPGSSYYLSSDELLSEDDLLVEETRFNDLGIQFTHNISHSLTLPQEMEPGSYYLIVALDAGQTYPESNEENNIQTVSFKLKASGPNLLIGNVSLDPQDVAAGVPFNTSFSTINRGNLYASSSYSGLYASEDSILNETDILVGSRYISSLYSGNQADYSITATLNSSFKPGSYYLLLVADIYDKIDETIETDNVFTLPITVIPPSFDLEITGSNIQDTLRTPELSNVSIELQLINQGAHTITDDFKINSYISKDSVFDVFGDTYAGNTEVRTDCYPGIPLGVFLTSYIPQNVGNGQYWLFFFLDAEGNVEELDETNNVYRIPLVITDLDVDIAVTEMELVSDTLTINETARCGYTIANLGTTYCQNTIRAEFFSSWDTILDSKDVYIGYQLHSRLNAKDSSSNTVSLYLPVEYRSGDSYLFVKVSTTGDESPDNNTQYHPVYVKPLDNDLAMGSVDLNPTESYPGEEVNMYFWTRNLGYEDITKSFWVKYFLSEDMVYDETDLLLGEEYFSRLYGNTTQGKSVDFSVPQFEAGTFYILLIADMDNNIKETDESNNSTFVPLNIMAHGSFPDYCIENVNFDHDPEENQINVQFTIYNRGIVEGGSATSCHFYASTDEHLDENDQFLGQLSIDKLSPDAEISYEFDGTIPNKELNYVIFIVDETELIEDGNRYNNIYYLELDYELAYDLDLRGELASQVITPGDTLAINTQVFRQGSPFLDSVLISYYIGRDSILEFAEKPILEKMLTLSGNELTMDHFSYTMPETVEEGEWYALVYLNWDSVWIESTSANNYIILPFKIEQSTDFVPDNLNSPEIKLYPNPASEFVFVESPEIMEEYSMTDLNGRVVDNGKPMNTKARIAVDALPPGYYQLLVRTGKDLQVLRFAIE